MSRRNRWLMLCFLLLTVATLAVEQPWRGDAHQRTYATTLSMFPDLREGVSLGQVRIQAQGQTTTIAQVMEQGKPRWVVREMMNHPADLARVGSLIESLRALETRDIESVNPEMQAAYKVSEDLGIRVEAWSEDGELLADVIAGSMRSQDVTSGQVAVLEFFVRPSDSDVVYRTGEFAIPFQDPADWCDTHFLSQVAPEQLHTIQRVDHDTQDSWKLVRQEEEGWRMVSPNAAKVPDFVGDSWVFTLAGLRAADVVAIANTPEGDKMLGSVSDSLRVGIGDETFEIHIGKLLSSDRRVVQVVGLPHLYALQEFDVDQLLQSVDRMLRDDG